MKSFKPLIDQALDSMDDVRQKLSELLNEYENEEGCEEVIKCINLNAPAFIKANNALEDILSSVEDLESE